VAILRRVLLEGQAVSTVCEKHDVSPTLFYTWPKQFFEHGAAAFAKEASAERRDLERQIDALQQRLGQKDRVIAKVTEEFVKLKKMVMGRQPGPPCTMKTGYHRPAFGARKRRGVLVPRVRKKIAVGAFGTPQCCP